MGRRRKEGGEKGEWREGRKGNKLIENERGGEESIRKKRGGYKRNQLEKQKRRGKEKKWKDRKQKRV